MQFRPLPIEKELADIANRDGLEEANRVRRAIFSEVARTQAFQLIVGAMRNIEGKALQELKLGRGNVGRLLGALECIESLRRTFCSYLPEAERANVDWYDDVDEPLIIDDDIG